METSLATDDITTERWNLPPESWPLTEKQHQTIALHHRRLEGYSYTTLSVNGIVYLEQLTPKERRNSTYTTAGVIAIAPNGRISQMGV